MDCNTPGFPVCHYLPEFSQTHVYWAGGAIQPSHPLSLPSPPHPPQSFPESGSFPMSHLFASGSQIFGASASASVFQWIFKVDFLWDWIVWSPSSKELSRVFSSTIGKHQSSALSPPYSSPFTSVRDYWKNHSFDYTDVKLMKSLVLTLIMLF